jgi:murein peptide amidase A
MRDFGALAARIEAACPAPLTLSVYGQQTSLDGTERYDLFLVRVPSQTRLPRFRVLLNGGTHGDEPAGAEAVITFLERRLYRKLPAVAFTVTPCTNPWGYVHNTREGPGGRDLNRAFQRATRVTPQVSLYKRALRGQRFDLFIDCHEDVDAPGLYVFARGGNLGRAIVDAVRPVGPIHPGDLVDGEIPLLDGVVSFPARRRRPRLAGSTRHLSGYVSRFHQPDPQGRIAAPRSGRALLGSYAAATVETPTRLPMRQRVRMHLTAIDAALSTLTEK